MAGDGALTGDRPALDELLRVLALLDENEPPSAEEVADALWLAGRLPARLAQGPGERPAPAPPAPGSRPSGRRAGTAARAGQSRVMDQPVPATSVHLPAAPGAPGAGGMPAGVPAVPAIRSALAVQRALRPLHRRSASRTESVVDEEATAEVIADTGIWLPQCHPALQRWLDVALVVDESQTMSIWQPVVAEFRTMLERQGAFRDVRTWRMSMAGPGGPVRLRADGSPSARDPAVLAAGGSPRLVLVISDCVHRAWADGRVGAVLESWGSAQPVTLIQPLPQRMWSRHCPPFTPVLIRPDGPAAPNTRLAVRPRTVPGLDLSALGVPVPVVEMEPRWLGPWAELVARPGPDWSAGVVMFTRQPGGHQARPGTAQPVPAQPLDAVLQFQASVSPTAFRLASFLAAAPLSLPIMRLVQHVMLPESRPGHLAEVYLSGLVQPVEPSAAGVFAVGYDFRPGVRELLLSALSRTEVLRVAAEVSRFVSDRLGSPVDFRALFTTHSRLGRLPAGERFTSVARHVLQALGGSYADIAHHPAEPAHTLPRSATELHRFTVPSHRPGETVTTSQPESGGRHEPPAAEQPAIWGGVPARNPNFTGREQLLLDLRAQLGRRTSVLLPQALHGLGGVGKTQLAVEYVHRFATDYQLVWWISAEQVPLIRSSLAELGSRMGLAAEDDASGTIRNVLEALRQGRPYARWLLVFDNADAPQAVEEYLPYPTGHVLITSRNPMWANQAQALEVDVFSRAESIQFIQHRGRDISMPDADRLAEALGDLPLALEQAAAWQRETSMPVPDYLQLLGERMAELLSENAPADYPRPVAATWGLALDQLTEQWPAAAELLRLCAFFSPEPIAERLLTAGRVLNLPDLLGQVLRDPVEFSRAKRDIGRYALARSNPAEKTIQVHRLIQRVLRDQLTAGQRHDYRAIVHQLMYAADPGDPDDQGNWERLAEISNHIFGSDLISAETAQGREVVLDIIRYRYERGDYQSCRELGEATVLAWWQALGADDEQTLVAVRELANAWRALGMTEEAREYTRDTLERMRAVFGDDHEHTLSTARGYAADLRLLGDYPAARTLDEEILPNFRRVFGEDHLQTLRCANNLGVDLRLAGDFYAALELDEDTLDRSRRYLGADHKHSLHCAGQLVKDLRGTGRYDDALGLLEEILPIYESRLGPEHPDVVIVRLGGAATMRRAGRYQEGKAEAERCLKLYRARFGDRHPDTISAMTILAELLRCLGETEQARTLSQTAADLAREVYEGNNVVPYLFDNNLAIILRAEGDLDRARLLDERAREEIVAETGLDHSYALCVSANLASDFFLAGDHERARELDADTLERSIRVRRDEHPLTLGCKANLGLDLRALGDVTAGERLLEEIVLPLDIFPITGDPEVALVKNLNRLQFDIEPPRL
jgi:Tetratricopeptide repeat